LSAFEGHDGDGQADSLSDLSGRVAVVTGAAAGLGRAEAIGLAKAGATVVINDIESALSSTDVFDEIKAAGGTAIAVAGDVSERSTADAMVSAAEREGGLDIVVNNAGVTADGMTVKMSDEDWYKVLGVNLSGAFFTSKAALPHMVERGSGRIVNISSIIGQTGNIGQANYAASKSGLFGLTMSMAKEAAFALKRADKLTPEGLNITVNAVAPGFIETDMLDGVPEKVLDKIRSEVPLDRLGRPEEIARVVHFLSADESSYITGQVWAVNGGQEM
jgi:acetoacetyl-CoA reductase/3-oxoacyl-[acyl-carrier protein] reductase